MWGHRIGALFGYTHVGLNCCPTFTTAVMLACGPLTVSPVLLAAQLLGGWPGSQAEFTRVPFGDVNLLKVPEDLPSEKLLLLSDVCPTGPPHLPHLSTSPLQLLRIPTDHYTSPAPVQAGTATS